jgi:hypothetical protein
VSIFKNNDYGKNGKEKFDFHAKEMHPSNWRRSEQEKTEPVGFVIYIPHECVLPSRYDHENGTIFQCLGTKVVDEQGNTRTCGDRHELQNGSWVRIYRAGYDGPTA